MPLSLSRLTRPLPFGLSILLVALMGGATVFIGWRQTEFVDIAIFTDISRAEALIEEGAFWLDEHQTSPLEHRRNAALEEFTRARIKLEGAQRNIALLGDPSLSAAIEKAIEGVGRLNRIAVDPAFDRDQRHHSLFMKEHLRTSKLVADVTEQALRLRGSILSEYQKKLVGFAVTTLILTLVAFRVILSLAKQEVRAKEEYARLQERYRHMVEGIRDILFIYQTSPVPRFVYVSPGIEELVGFNAEAHYENPRLWHERVENVALLEEVLSGRRPPHEAHLLRLRDEQTPRWLEMAVTPFSESAGVVTQLGILRDVTDHREAQEQLRRERDRAEEATRMKDKFVALVSHDIRSPLSSLLGLLTLLVGRDDEFLLQSGRMILGKTIESGQHLLELSNQLLGLARIQSGEVALKKGPVNLCRRATASIGLLEGAAMAKEVAIENRLPQEMTVVGDEIMLGQVVQNLLSNALKFTPRRGKIVVDGETNEAGVRFWVEDSGIGISPDRIDGLFDAAVCRSTPGTEQERGVGFGLPLVREIVEAHGGSVGVTSTPGKGSRFTVTIPLST